ncbi:MAG TPA: RcpC/CpaB family pilus assembly protein, partial [Stellaceae bacterium]|nr:RcpC/CpaB family pilus assembly protein [Stellaceae bacterium]
NVRVIAIDQKLDSKPGEATVAKTATFEVTPKQSEIVALASEMGKLSLSLRSLVPGPNETAKEDATDLPPGAPTSPLSETYTVDSDISPLLHAPDKAPKPGSADVPIVTILRGGSGQSTVASGNAPQQQQ